MKNILIAGVPRSGKSFFSKIVCHQLNYFYFPFDSIIGTFEKLYPESGINLKDKTEIVSQKITPFLAEFMNNLNLEGINYIFDGYHIFPSDIVKCLQTEKLEILYFGYADMDPTEKFEIIRHFQAENSWTASLSDSELKKRIKRYIEESRIMKADCEKYGFSYFDTGKDYFGEIVNAFNFIKNKYGITHHPLADTIKQLKEGIKLRKLNTATSIKM